MELLIRDLIRRTSRWMTVGMTLVIAVGWFWIAVEAPDPAIPAMAFRFSMGMAWVMGPQLHLWLVPLAVWYLPVARRDVWRAGWLVSTVGITGLLFAAKLPGTMLTPARDFIGFSGLLLSTAYDFAATGAGCALVIAATSPGPSRGPLRVIWPVVRGASQLLLPAGYLFLSELPRWAGLTTPVQWSALTPRAAIALGTGVALTIAAYFYSPRPPVPANRTKRQAPQRSNSARLESRSGLTGVPWLLAHEYVWIATLAGYLALVGAAAAAMASLTESGAEVVQILVNVLLSFDGLSPSLSTPMAASSVLVCYVALLGAIAARFNAILRHLRTLPLGLRGLNALLLTWPIIVWLSVGAALAGARYVFRHELPSASFAITLVTMIGISALLQATTLWLSGAARATAIGSLLLAIVGIRLLVTASPALFGYLGVVSFAAAAWMNSRALARATPYRSAGHGFLRIEAAR